MFGAVGKKQQRILCNPWHEARLSVVGCKARQSAAFPIGQCLQEKSDTLARRISTAQAQEMQKSSYWTTVVTGGQEHPLRNARALFGGRK
jgi:hypothetical protein